MLLRNSIYVKLFISHFLAVFIISGGISIFLYTRASDSLHFGLQERLQSSAALISLTLDANDIRHIRSQEDVDDPAYIQALGQLRAMKRVNHDIAYLYIMRIEGGRVFFVVDSDETDGQAMPGYEYTLVVPNLLRGFHSVTVNDTIVSDEWGAFLMSFAPIKNGNGEFLLGVDMRADDVQEKYRDLRISALISLLVALVLAFFLARFIAGRFMPPINLAIKGCTDIAAGKFNTHIDLRTNDELAHLLTAFNDMAAALNAAEKLKNDTFAELKQSRDELETRVEQRTSDLKEVNDRLSNEIAMRLVAQQALHEAATTDTLTRLWNRRATIERLEHEIARSKRTKNSFTVMMMDLDHFKNINDTKGHSAGDAILEETALRMRSMLRSQDLAARWGGEEFVILLPDTSAEQGQIVAEKLRCRLADSPYFHNGEAIYVTASFGVAQYDGLSEVMAVVNAADKAMYDAKKNGRNRVEMD